MFDVCDKFLGKVSRYVIRNIEGTMLADKANGTYLGKPCIYFEGDRKEYMKRYAEIYKYNFMEGTSISITKPAYFSF